METGKFVSVITLLATGGAMFSTETRNAMFEHPLAFVPAAIGFLHLIISSIGIDINPTALISRNSLTSSRRNKPPRN